MQHIPNIPPALMSFLNFNSREDFIVAADPRLRHAQAKLEMAQEALAKVRDAKADVKIRWLRDLL